VREAWVAIIVVAVGMSAVLGSYVARSMVHPEPIRKASQPPPTFEERWAAATNPGLVAVSTLELQPRRVTIERVVKPEIIVAGATEAKLAAEPEKKTVRDVCRGKGKIWFRGGKKWRCKR